MPEQITIESEAMDDPDEIRVITNLNLTTDGDVEVYDSPEEGDEGSPVAQALFMADGLESLRLEGNEMVARREAGVAWHDLLDDVRAVLIDFFL